MLSCSDVWSCASNIYLKQIRTYKTLRIQLDQVLVLPLLKYWHDCHEVVHCFQKWAPQTRNRWRYSTLVSHVKRPTWKHRTACVETLATVLEIQINNIPSKFNIVKWGTHGTKVLLYFFESENYWRLMARRGGVG